MQFLVFAAFAIVLSVPEGGPPWSRIQSPAGTWAVVIVQVLAAALVGLIWSRLVRQRLEREPAWLPAAQRKLAQASLVFRVVVGAGLVASIYFTDWTVIVRHWPVVNRIWGLPELIVLLPFFLAILAGWALLYPADRAVRQVALELRLWALAPARPVWSLAQYLSFNFRQHVLIILIPMVPIVVGNDFVFAYSGEIRRATRLPWADQAVLACIAGLVFLLAPVMLRHVWHTRVLPPGELRERLDTLCRRIGLAYRRILIWESDGMMINAAVMGLTKPLRYILLSDGLLEMMDDEQIEAVFGHEAGHVKLRHIEFYLLFAICSMFVVGGIFLLIQLAAHQWPALFPDSRVLQDYLQVSAMIAIVLIWGLGFGIVSRRFEWQADLFGARSVTPTAEHCSRPCLLHGTAEKHDPDLCSPCKGEERAEAKSPPLCSTAASIFADALERIAALNGIPIEARSWRHSSIANRMRLLSQYAQDPTRSARLELSVRIIKAVLLLGTLIGCIVSVYIYWPGNMLFR